MTLILLPAAAFVVLLIAYQLVWGYRSPPRQRIADSVVEWSRGA